MKQINKLNIKTCLKEIATNNYQIGSNASKLMDLSIDIETILLMLVEQFEKNNENYVFNSIYDQQFIDLFKKLIKTPDEFNPFLKKNFITIDEFMKIGIYLAPHCFTSHLIKFIRKTYLTD